MRAPDNSRRLLLFTNASLTHYPDTKEEGRSILSMASLGVDKPGIKAFRSLSNIHYYREPMNTYDSLIMKNAQGDLGEEAMLQKAVALR